MQCLVPATVFSPLLLSTFHDSRLCAVGESCGISLVSLLPPDLSTLANHRSSATTIKHWYPLSCQSFAAHSIAKIYPHSNSSSLPFALAIRPPCQQSSHPCRHHHLRICEITLDVPPRYEPGTDQHTTAKHQPRRICQSCKRVHHLP